MGVASERVFSDYLKVEDVFLGVFDRDQVSDTSLCSMDTELSKKMELTLRDINRMTRTGSVSDFIKTIDVIEFINTTRPDGRVSVVMRLFYSNISAPSSDIGGGV